MTDALYRTNDGPVAGVCGGIARKLAIDPGVMRIVWVVLTVLSGGALAAVYAVLWLVLQREPGAAAPRPVDVAPEAATSRCACSGTAGNAGAGNAGATAKTAASPTPRKPAFGVAFCLVAGLVLLAFGVTLLLDRLLDGFSLWQFFPLLAMAAGVARLAIPGRRGYTFTGIVEGAVALVLGIVVLLGQLDIVHLRVASWFSDNWPLLLIMAGLLLQARALDSVALSALALAVLALFFLVGFGFYLDAGAGADAFMVQRFGHGVRVPVLPGGSPA